MIEVIQVWLAVCVASRRLSRRATNVYDALLKANNGVRLFHVGVNSLTLASKYMYILNRRD